MSINNDVAIVPPLKPWQDLTLINGWLRFSMNYATARAYLDPFGVVHLSGLIRAGANFQFATLPVGMRPDFRLEIPSLLKFPTTGFQPTLIAINSLGAMFSSSAGVEWLTLDSITFRAV